MNRMIIMLFAVSALLLSGCMYPSSELSKNRVPNEVQLEMVQEAVEQFKENNDGLVPIKTKPNDTPVYRKYLLDFTKLKEQNLLAEIPGTAFENGGVYQYVLIDPEENPQVKLIDLRIAQQVREMQRQVNMYRSEHTYPPFGSMIGERVFEINYDKLGIEDSPLVESPYSQQKLPLVMDVTGIVYVDYRADLYQAIQDHPDALEKGADIRQLLAEHTPFVPAYSLPYAAVNGEPVFSTLNRDENG